MKIFPPPSDIGDTDGFKPELDIFKRAELGAGLTSLVSRVSEPMVVALDGDWGSGKSTFLKMWAGELRNKDFPVIWFDAFESDHIDDAFIALAGEVLGLVKSKAKKSEAKNFKKKAVAAGRVLLAGGARVAAKAVLGTATAGLVDAEKLEGTVKDIVQDVGKDLGSEVSKGVGALLESTEDRKATMRDFREGLAKVPDLLVPNSSAVDKPRKPLIFIVDELDRCKPLFALNVLERIKHFFSVPNVHFVLGVHLTHLAHVVEGAYGSKVDGRLYLEKFIHVSVPLVESRKEQDAQATSIYINHLARRMLEFQNDQGQSSGLQYALSTYCIWRPMSLRTVERVFTYLSLSLAVGGGRYNAPPEILAGLCILKVRHPAIYVKAKQGRLTFEDATKTLGLGNSVDQQHKAGAEYVTGVWQYLLNETVPQSVSAEFQQMFYRWHDKKSVITATANEIIDRLVPFGST